MGLCGAYTLLKSLKNPFLFSWLYVPYTFQIDDPKHWLYRFQILLRICRILVSYFTIVG